MPEDDDAAAAQRHCGHGGVAPVDEVPGGLVGHVGLQTLIRPGPHVQRRRPAVLGQGAVERVGINHARLRSAVAAGDIDGCLPRELLQQRDGRQLREGPRIRHAHQDIDIRLAELLGDDVGLGLAVHEHGRVDDGHRRLVRQHYRAADGLGRHLGDILAAGPALFVDSRIARREYADHRDLRRRLADRRQPGCFTSSGHAHSFRFVIHDLRSVNSALSWREPKS
ncbi:MAG: hypothetical protein MUC88_06750 [Planctomycetes bacterium]|nr:hypothetical protein [Planctomycetota bacterium]